MDGLPADLADGECYAAKAVGRACHRVARRVWDGMPLDVYHGLLMAEAMDVFPGPDTVLPEQDKTIKGAMHVMNMVLREAGVRTRPGGLGGYDTIELNGFSEGLDERVGTGLERYRPLVDELDERDRPAWLETCR